MGSLQPSRHFLNCVVRAHVHERAFRRGQQCRENWCSIPPSVLENFRMRGRQTGNLKMVGRSNSTNAGTLAAAAWLSSLGLNPPPGTLRWHAEISLDVREGPAPAEFDEARDSRFHLDIYSEEWGFFFCHAGRVSWIRITDIPFVHGRDDHHLLTQTPALPDVGKLLRSLETKHEIKFRRAQALIRTNVVAAEPMIRRWLLTL